MPFLGLGYSPPTPVEALLQSDRLALARVVAEATPQKTTLLGSLVHELSGLLGLSESPQISKFNPAPTPEVVFTPEFTKGTFWDPSSAARKPLVTTVSGRPAVWDGRTHQYSVALADKIIATAKRRREYDNNFYRNRGGSQLPFPGSPAQGHDPCTLGSMVDEMSGMGALTETIPRQGTIAWWRWYATVYLPRYYSAQQIQQYVAASPYYQYFGSPYGYGGQQYQQPFPASYSYVNQGTQYQYPYSYNQYNYLADPYYQAQYTYANVQQQAYDCQAQGGYYDYGQQTCGLLPGQTVSATQYGVSSTPPNVVGMPAGTAVTTLNRFGYNVWLLNQDGISGGVPPGYSANRVSISVKNGIVDSSAVG